MAPWLGLSAPRVCWLTKPSCIPGPTASVRTRSVQAMQVGCAWQITVPFRAPISPVPWGRRTDEVPPQPPVVVSPLEPADSGPGLCRSPCGGSGGHPPYTPRGGRARLPLRRPRNPLSRGGSPGPHFDPQESAPRSAHLLGSRHPPGCSHLGCPTASEDRALLAQGLTPPSWLPTS